MEKYAPQKISTPIVKVDVVENIPVEIETSHENFQVKVTTYGNFKWINFAELWDTGFEEKGGIVLIRVE